MIAALMPPDIGNVTSHAMTMFRKMDQSTFSRARNRPTNTTDPTLQCVVLMGTPTLEATSTVSAEPISIQKPLQHTGNVTTLPPTTLQCSEIERSSAVIKMLLSITTLTPDQSNYTY